MRNTAVPTTRKRADFFCSLMKGMAITYPRITNSTAGM